MHEQEATKWKVSKGMKRREPGAEGRKEINMEPEGEEEKVKKCEGTKQTARCRREGGG